MKNPTANRMLLLPSLLLMSLAPMHAGAISTLSFTFNGTCAVNDCIGNGIGTLVVQNYTQGTALAPSDFVSFTYSSSVFPSFSITSPIVFTGNIPVTLPAEAQVTLVGTGGQLVTNPGSPGNWCLGPSCVGDHGGVYNFSVTSAVPEPGAFTLLAMGLGVIGLARRRP